MHLDRHLLRPRPTWSAKVGHVERPTASGNAMKSWRVPCCSISDALTIALASATRVHPDECPAGHPCSTYDFGATEDPSDDVRYCWNPLGPSAYR